VQPYVDPLSFPIGVDIGDLYAVGFYLLDTKPGTMKPYCGLHRKQMTQTCKP